MADEHRIRQREKSSEPDYGTYTPPDDPAILGGDQEDQDLEMAAGFAPSVEDAQLELDVLSDRGGNRSFDLAETVLSALRLNSETGHLRDIRIQARDGVVTLVGTVMTRDDLGRVFDIVSELEVVREVRSFLEVRD